MAAEEVTIKDSLVLNAIFNPHNALEINEEHHPVKTGKGVIEDIGKELKQLEIDAVNAAQNGKLRESLNMFNELLQQVPKYPSGYNNRAQLLRLQGMNL